MSIKPVHVKSVCPAGDTYAGGNPWVLSSAALANLFYRAGREVLQKNQAPGDDARTAWATAFGLSQDAGGSESFPTSPSGAANVFLRAGDSVLLRVRSHVEADGFHLAEQIDRDSGLQKSAKDLTWSYAETLSAMDARGKLVALLLVGK